MLIINGFLFVAYLSQILPQKSEPTNALSRYKASIMLIVVPLIPFPIR